MEKVFRVQLCTLPPNDHMVPADSHRSVPIACEMFSSEVHEITLVNALQDVSGLVVDLNTSLQNQNTLVRASDTLGLDMGYTLSPNFTATAFSVPFNGASLTGHLGNTHGDAHGEAHTVVDGTDVCCISKRVPVAVWMWRAVDDLQGIGCC